MVFNAAAGAQTGQEMKLAALKHHFLLIRFARLPPLNHLRPSHPNWTDQIEVGIRISEKPFPIGMPMAKKIGRCRR
jgi:hypothetical protein